MTQKFEFTGLNLYEYKKLKLSDESKSSSSNKVIINTPISLLFLKSKNCIYSSFAQETVNNKSSLRSSPSPQTCGPYKKF